MTERGKFLFFKICNIFIISIANISLMAMLYSQMEEYYTSIDNCDTRTAVADAQSPTSEKAPIFPPINCPIAPCTVMWSDDSTSVIL